MADATHAEELSLSVKDFEHSFDKFFCIFHVEPIGEPDMFLTHPISFVFSINFLNIGFSCTSWSHTRNVILVGYALTAHRWPGKWQHSQPCLSLREKHVKYIRKAEFLSSNQQHLRESCMPQILTLFFQCPFFLFLFCRSTNYILDSGGWARHELSDIGKTSCPCMSVCMSLENVLSQLPVYHSLLRSKP